MLPSGPGVVEDLGSMVGLTGNAEAGLPGSWCAKEAHQSSGLALSCSGAPGILKQRMQSLALTSKG